MAEQKCTCVSCDTCHGTGSVEVPDPYLGGYDLDMCDDCCGDGVTEECDYCIDAREQEQERL